MATCCVIAFAIINIDNWICCLAELWAEANPLPHSEVVGILQQASTIDDRKISLGLDSSQLAGTTSAQKAATGQHLRPGDIIGQGQGYFKLSRGREGDVISADGTTGATHTPLQLKPSLYLCCMEHLPSVHDIMSVWWTFSGRCLTCWTAAWPGTIMSAELSVAKT